MSRTESEDDPVGFEEVSDFDDEDFVTDDEVTDDDDEAMAILSQCVFNNYRTSKDAFSARKRLSQFAVRTGYEVMHNRDANQAITVRVNRLVENSNKFNVCIFCAVLILFGIAWGVNQRLGAYDKELAGHFNSHHDKEHLDVRKVFESPHWPCVIKDPNWRVDDKHYVKVDNLPTEQEAKEST